MMAGLACFACKRVNTGIFGCQMNARPISGNLTLWILLCVIGLVQLACIGSAAIPTPSARVATILALTSTPGSSLPSPTVHPTITRTSTPTSAVVVTPRATQTKINELPAPPEAALATPLAAPGKGIPRPGQLLSPANANRAVELTRLGAGRVSSAGFSWDGKLLGVETTAGRKLYDQASLAELEYSPKNWEAGFGPVPGELGTVRLSDGIYLEETLSGELKVQLEGALSEELVFSPDYSLAAGMLTSDQIGLWDTATGKLFRRLDTRSIAPETGCLNLLGLDLSPNNQLAAAGCGDSGVGYVWRISDGALLHVFQTSAWRMGSVKFAPNSQLLASVVATNRVLLWRVSDGELLRILDNAPGTWQMADGSLAFSPDGYYLVAGFPNGALLAWRMADGTLLRQLQGTSYYSNQPGRGLAIAADGSRLAFSSWDRVQVIDPVDGRLVYEAGKVPRAEGALAEATPEAARKTGPSGFAQDIAISPDSRTLAIIFEDGKNQVRLFRLVDGEEQESIRVPAQPLLVRYAPDGLSVAIVTTGGTYFYKVSDHKPLWFLEPDQEFDIIDSAGFSPDGSLFFLGRYDTGLVFWDWQHRQIAKEINSIPALSAAYSPGGTLLAVGTGSTISLYQADNMTALSNLNASGKTLAFSPDGSLLAGENTRGDVVLFSTQDYSQSAVIQHNKLPVMALAFSPNGRWLASASQDGTVSLWGVYP